MHHGFFVLLLIVICSPLGTLAAPLPDPNFTTFNTQNGLSNANVYNMVQDEQGYMWFGTEDGLNRFDGKDFTVYRYASDDPNSLASNNITALVIDSQQRIWVGTDNGLSLFNADTQLFINIQTKDGLTNNRINAITEVDGELWVATDDRLNTINLDNFKISAFSANADGSGTNKAWVGSILNEHNTVWITTWGGGLNRFDKQTRQFRYYTHNPDKADSLSTDAALSVFRDSFGQLWVGTFNSTLNLFNATCDCFTRLQPAVDIKKIAISNMIEANGYVWMASSAGLLQMNMRTREFSNYKMLKQFELGHANRDVRTLFLSADKTLWLGSASLGLVAVTPDDFAFQSYFYSEKGVNTLAAEDVSGLAITENGEFWTGAVDGLYKYAFSASGQLGKGEKLSDDFALQIIQAQDNNYWVASNKGLVQLNAQGQILKRFKGKQIVPAALHDTVSFSYVYAVSQGRSGNIYAGMWRAGLVELDNPELGTFNAIGHADDPRGTLQSQTVLALLNDTDNNLWIGTDNGIDRYSKKDNQIRNYPLDTLANQPNVAVNQIIQSANNIWLATNNGVYQYQSSQDAFVKLNLPLKSSAVQALAQVQDNEMWMSTANGIYKWTIDSGKLQHFTATDGLQRGSFNAKSVLPHPQLGVFFGGINGVSRIKGGINQSPLPARSTQPRLQWLDAIISGPEITQGVIAQINFPPSLFALDEPFSLDYDTQAIELKYFVSDYWGVDTRQYRYRINQGAWIEHQNQTSVILNELKPGEYTIELAYLNVNEQWIANPQLVNFSINAPFYQTPIAYFVFALTLILLISGFYHWRNMRLRQRQVWLEEMVQNKTSEVQALLEQKERLFTNISHELRTPLTLINGPLQQLNQDTLFADKHRVMLDLAMNNTKRLTNLVEKVVALAAVVQPNKILERINIDNELNSYINAFTPLFAEKQIQIKTSINSHVILECNSDDVHSIIENLLSNALKYSPVKGWVSVCSEIREGDYVLTIENAHKGLTPKQTQQVFARFERLDAPKNSSGFGLGLAFVKELCDEYHWNIHCNSITNHSVTFELSAHYAEIDEIHENDDIDENETILPVKPNRSHLPLILIVDDSADMRDFLTSMLTPKYAVITAANGLEGLTIAIAEIPHLILSDVVMPELSGYELLEKLNAHPNTSHIPTILVTGKNDAISATKGLTLGSVDYITKPFDAEQLLLKIHNTLTRQHSLVAGNAKNATTSLQPKSVFSPQDQHFAAKLNTIIAEQYTDSDFTLGGIVSELGMSDRQLQRKIKALFDQTPAEYLRHYRVFTAQKMLLEGQQITQVAYSCGFKSPNYFSTCFKRVFGVSPSEFINQQN